MIEICELNLEIFTDMIVEKLQEIDGLEVILDNPQADSKFPCASISTPLKSVINTENGIPTRVNLSVSVSYWTNSKHSSMKLSDNADIKLRELNLTRVNSPIDSYDEITRKYRYGGSYEVFFNGLTNSLERRR